MKATVFVLIMSGLLLGSCSAEDDGLNSDDGLTSIEVSGRLVSQVTGEGIAGGVISSVVKEYIGSGTFGYSIDISTQETQTDENGYFTAYLSYKDSENVFLFEQINEQLATSMLQEKSNFYLSDLESGEPLIFVARKYEELQIKLKNTTPFDENDAIGIDFFQKGTSFSNSVIYQIENFGNQNETWGPPAGEDGLNPYWIGDNVDSVIYGHIQEGTSVKISWSVRENGIVNEYHSDFFETVSGEVNLYEINY